MAHIESDGVDVHFEVVGRGYPVVMLPPGGFDGSFWRAAGYTTGLHDVATCISVDPRGLGRSGRPAESSGYRVDALAGDVLAIVDHLGVAQFTVWGASLGGAIGLLLGAEHPDRVTAVVLSGMCPQFHYAGPLEAWAGLAQLAREIGDIAQALGQICDQEGVPADSWVREHKQGDADVVAQIFDGLREYEWDRRVAPGAFPLPTLILLGEHEDPGDVAATIAEAMPRARRIRLDGVGHVGGLIDAGRVLKHVRPFLQNVAIELGSTRTHGAYSDASDL